VTKLKEMTEATASVGLLLATAVIIIIIGQKVTEIIKVIQIV